MASRPLAALLRPTPPTTRLLLARTLHHPTTRPRLPPLLRPTTSPLTPRPHPHPTPIPSTRRLISAKTKAYLWRESLIAARIITYGYTALLLAALLTTAATLITTHNAHPTPSSLPLHTRASIALARAIVAWTNNHAAASEVLRNVLADLDALPYDLQPTSWKTGRLMVLQLLAEYEETAGEIPAALTHYMRILQTPREAPAAEERWADIRVSAALRVAKIAEFQHRPEAAEEALKKAVFFARPAATDEDAELPPPGSPENTPLLLKALTELGVFYAQHGKEEVALDVFTRVLAARRSAPVVVDPGDSKTAAGSVWDPCAEAATMTYIGEVMFAMGQKGQGVAWSREAFARSEPLAELRGRCRECALVAGRNLRNMVAIMEQERAERGGKKEGGGRFSRFFGGGKEDEVAQGETVEKWDEAVRLLERIRISRGL